MFNISQFKPKIVNNQKYVNDRRRKQSVASNAKMPDSIQTDIESFKDEMG